MYITQRRSPARAVEHWYHGFALCAFGLSMPYHGDSDFGFKDSSSGAVLGGISERGISNSVLFLLLYGTEKPAKPAYWVDHCFLGKKKLPKPGVHRHRGIGDLLWVGQNCLNDVVGLVWKADLEIRVNCWV